MPVCGGDPGTGEGVDAGPATARRAVRGPSSREHADSASTGSTPFVGRAREIALLTRYWAEAAAGRGQAVLLQGEAGIGKSRLVRALEAHVASLPHLRLRARGSEQHGNTAFHPVAELLQHALRLDPALPDGERLERLRAALAKPGMPGAEAAPDVAPLLGIEVPHGTAGRGRTPERRRQDMLAALRGIVLGLAASQPLLLVVEDLHWVDASTLELLGQLAEEATAARMLMVATVRPGAVPPWAERPEVGLMVLGRLGRGPVERIVSAVAAGRPLLPAVVAEIVDRTDGVPLFVEELTRMLVETGLAPADASPGTPLPSSLQDSLIARLDRLPVGRGTAQIAAVIGQWFSHAMIAAVAELDGPELQRDLTALVDAGLLYRNGEPPAADYTFRHALVQDAAGRMLEPGARQDCHRRIVGALEARGGAAPEVLAHHYAGAGLPAEAIDCRRRAGEEASRRLAYVEAIAHLTAAIQLLPDLPASPGRDGLELALRTALGVPLVAARGYGAGEVEACYVRAHDLCRALDDRPRQFAAVRGLWNLRLVRAELGRARDLAGRLLCLTAADDDPGRRVAAHRAMGVTLFSIGDYAAADVHFRQAIDAYDPGLHAALAPEHGADPCVVCMAYLATTTWALGYPDQALARIREALALARQLGHDLSVAVALTTASRFHQVRGEPARVREHATAVIALSEELGLPYWRALGTTLHGWAMAREGNPGGGILAIQRGRKALRDTGAGLIEPWNLAALAEANLRAGEPGIALGLLDQSLALAAATGERWWEAEQHRLAGECMLARGGSPDEAEACFGRALAVARSQQARSLELRSGTSMARLLARTGRRSEGRALLAEIHGWFTEGTGTPDMQAAADILLSL